MTQMLLRFLVDENIPAYLVKAFRAEGWDVEWVSETAPSVSDDVLIEIGKASSRILITADVELASRTLREPQSNMPTILLRMGNMDAQDVTRLVTTTLKQRTDWQELHAVLTPQKLRVKPILRALS
jgi:predicted nuclease of predicted toxin-antitoxin system